MINLINMNHIFFDAPMLGQLGFQDAASPSMEGIVDLHHYLFFFLVTIAVFVGWLLFICLWTFGINYNKNTHLTLNVTHGGVLEIIWTIIPAIILAIIAVPSFGLLYMIEEVVDPAVTLKVIGHQWYWSYEYSDYLKNNDESIAFDSYMVPTDDLQKGQLRLLEVDNRVILPTKTNIRFVITSADVLHCFAVPSLALKLDAVPGRLNQVGTFIKREGLYFGQCSEICGVNHGFMPIAIEAVNVDDYISWVSSKIIEE